MSDEGSFHSSRPTTTGASGISANLWDDPRLKIGAVHRQLLSRLA